MNATTLAFRDLIFWLLLPCVVIQAIRLRRNAPGLRLRRKKPQVLWNLARRFVRWRSVI